MEGYYTKRLAADRLKRCYEIGSAAVQRYLEAELALVAEKCRLDASVLELGCGFGRVLEVLATRAGRLVGIDTSPASLRSADTVAARHEHVRLALMDASHLAFGDQTFDLVLCIQNGISAFQVERKRLVREALRVTIPGGQVLFSSYSDSFWPHRLEWFQAQAAEGLIGEIDWSATGDGRIVCRDGFTASTVRPAEFRSLVRACDHTCQIMEIAGASTFCIVTRK